MKTFLKFLVIAVLSIQSLAGTIDPLTQDEKYIEYGSKFHYVLNICGMDHDGSMFNGSCVAIEKDWVVTAAHVVKEAKFCGIMYKSQALLVGDIFVHPDYGESFGKADIALCHLREDLDLSFYPGLYEGNDEKGKLCCISGYGFTGTFLTGAKIHDGHRRAGSNIIDGVIEDLLICSPSKTIKEKRTSLEFIIAGGDSGGGLFIGNKLAGINSCVIGTKTTPNSCYGNEAGHTRVSKFVSWIKKTIKKE